MVSVPIFDTELIESLGMEPSFMSSSGMDYSNYLFSISEFTKLFYKSDLVNLSDEDYILLRDFIRRGAYTGKTSFSRKFINKLG